MNKFKGKFFFFTFDISFYIICCNIYAQMFIATNIDLIEKKHKNLIDKTLFYRFG